MCAASAAAAHGPLTAEGLVAALNSVKKTVLPTQPALELRGVRGVSFLSLSAKEGWQYSKGSMQA